MTIDVDAVYEDGVLKPERPLALKEKARVRVTIEAKAEEALPVKDDDDPTGWKAAQELIGFIKDAPPDMAENHDDYLYKRRTR
jgi:predicted DNA-binding antitoxin AbrB/MazE fold protein